MNYTDKTKTLRLDSTLSQEPSKLQAIVNTTWLDHCHLRRQSRAGSFSHIGEWNRTGYPKFCFVRTVFNIFIFSLALIDILVGLVVQSALLEKSIHLGFFFFLLLLLFCFFFLLFCFFVVGFLFFFHCRAEIVCEELSLTALSLFASVLCYWLFPVSTLTAWQKLGLKQLSQQSGLCELSSFRYLKE